MTGGGVLVAVVWVRDGRGWRWLPGATAEEVRQRGEADRKAGWLPVDVAGYLGVQGEPAYLTLWVKANKGEEARLYVDVPASDHQAATDALKKELVPRTVHALALPDRQVRYSGVWSKGPAGGNLSWDQRRGGFTLLNLDQSAVDVTVAGSEELTLAVQRELLGWLGGFPGWTGLYLRSRAVPEPPGLFAIVWHVNPSHEEVRLAGLDLVAHRACCLKLAAQGYRPVSVNVATLTSGEQAASVWHRSAPAEGMVEQRGRQRATAAATLLQLGDGESAWPLFRHGPDPTARSFLVQRAHLLGVEAGLLVSRLDEEKDASARRALLLALGDYDGKELPAEVRQPLVKKLLRWYRDDPDPGMHGALDWLLRHAKEGEADRPLDWGQSQELERIDAQLASGAPSARAAPTPTWWVNSQGMTFTILPGPVEFRMGSPPCEPGRREDERPHQRRIDRSYALATKPVTVAQWQRFLAERPDVKHSYLKQYSPVPEGPIVGVTWYEAAQYCNWLSEKEGIPDTEWCYPGTIEEGMKLSADSLKRKGYRLPTEAEWEYACRAGALTERYYGSGLELLPRYAWYSHNTNDERTYPVGQKRPNDLGLFDMHGNVWTRCQGAGLDYPIQTIAADDKEDESIVNEKLSRVLRGASFTFHASEVRAAFRYFHRPGYRVSTVGVRVCRTCD
jgi:formylglycine-generating enzyme required for sulfatase activity